MDIWEDIQSDYEYLGLSISQLADKYLIDESEIQLRIDLNQWIQVTTEVPWPELFHKHQKLEDRLEMLEYLSQQALYHRSTSLEKRIYDKLISVADSIDPNFPITCLASLDALIKNFTSLKKTKLHIFEAMRQQRANELEAQLDPIKQGLTVNDIVDDIDDLSELENLKAIVERVKDKRSKLEHQPSLSGSISTQIH